MRKAAFILLAALSVVCYSPATSFAQEDRRLRFAITASGGIKYPFLGNGSRNYHLFGDAGFGVAARVSGSNERTLSFLPKLALMRENTGYHHTSSIKYFIETIDLVFNPEILFPTRNEKWQISAGIGIDWTAGINLAVYSDVSYNAGGSLDAVYDTISAARRRLIPFVSAGALYHVYKGFHLQMFLRQDLLDAFPDNTEITFRSSVDALTVNLSHQPTRLGLGILYFF